MQKKLLVAVLACLTIFLSKRSLMDSQAHAQGHYLGAQARAVTAGMTATASLSP